MIHTNPSMNLSLFFRKLPALCALALMPWRLFGGIAVAQYIPPATHRVQLNFNYDWKFIKQDVPGASAVAFDDSSWQAVSLPHSWNDDKFREWIFVSLDTKQDPLLPSGTYYGKAW